MLTLDALLRRRPKVVLAVWIVLLLAAAPLAARQADRLTGGGFTAPGSQSEEVEGALEQFPGTAGATLAAILVPRDEARPGDLRRAIGEVERKISGIGDVGVPDSTVRTAEASAEADPGRPVVMPFTVEGGDGRAIDVARDLREKLGIDVRASGAAAEGRVDVHVAGQGGVWAALQADTQKNVQVAEARAFPIIAIVLLAAFGSLAATVLPLGLGVAAVVLTGALIYLLALTTEMSIFVTNVASMLGLGVAVDYSLFVLVRYREEVGAGRRPAEARAVALATSGVAVVFSGLTVIAALAGLFLIDSTALGSIATGAILVVAIAVVASSILLPVLIAMLGRRAHEPGRLTLAFRRRSRAENRPVGREFWTRWSAAVMSRPLLSLLAGMAVLLALAAPALRLNIENPGLGQLGSDDPLRHGIATAAEVAGPGALGPVQILVSESRHGARPGDAVMQQVDAVAARDPEVAELAPGRPSQDGRSVLLTAVLRTDPSSEEARAAVRRLRAELPAVAGERAGVAVGGTTAVLMDFDDLVRGSMWKIALFILALSFAVLLVLLRSLLLPLKAVLMTILSVLAAYGVVVAIFQWGWLDFLGLESAPYIDTITPPLVLVIAFGLSMDYEVFMLSRIRERYATTGDNRRAVAEGLASSARTITSAALIMIAVFLAFVSAGLPSVQRLGVACAVAIALDATVVRLVLVPAAMALLGRWNWWLPAPLAHLLASIGPDQVRQEPTILGQRRA